MKRRRGNEYKDSIVRFLSEANQLMDVENIRKACHIGNWQTAMKHCLELQYEGKIQGIKSSKSWIFWINSSKNGVQPALLKRVCRSRGEDVSDFVLGIKTENG